MRRLIDFMRSALVFMVLGGFGMPIYAQPGQVQINADCVIRFQGASALTASGGTQPTAQGFDNRAIGCNSWQISYANNGFATITLAIQEAPDNSGVPGAFATLGGTATFGVNPNTNTTAASALIQSYGTNFAPWVRVALTSATGSGSVQGILLGYRAAGSAGTSGGGTASSVNVSQYGGNNVISAGTNGAFSVGGTAATGVPPTANPVLVGGTDGTNQHSLITDTFGAEIPGGIATALANGVSNTQLLGAGSNGGSPLVLAERAFPMKYNGSTWDRDQNCATAKPVITNLASSGNTTIFTGTAAQNIYICDVEFSTGTPEDFKLTEGTTANCASGTADATALMKNISAWSLTPGGGTTAYLITQTAGDNLCANQAGTQAAGVTVWAIKY